VSCHTQVHKGLSALPEHIQFFIYFAGMYFANKKVAEKSRKTQGKI